MLKLPEEHTYTVESIDTWNMTRTRDRRGRKRKLCSGTARQGGICNSGACRGVTKRLVRRTDCVSAKSGQFLVGHVKNSSLLNCRTFFILCLEDKTAGMNRYIDYIGIDGISFRKQEDCMRKKVASLLTAAMTMSLLAGCGSDSVSGENNAADITAGGVRDGTVDP